MEGCFVTHTRWGADAGIRSGFVERRAAAGNEWRPEWQVMFTHQDGEPVEQSSLRAVRTGYNILLAALVADVELLEPRQRYASSDVVFNAR